MGLYNTHLRKATLDTLAKNTDEISDEQKLKVNKVTWDASQKFQKIADDFQKFDKNQVNE